MSVRPLENTALRADERAMLERVVTEFAPRMLAYVARVYPAAGEPEDVVAEAFVRAASHVASWGGRERPELYLFAIVRNLCRDQRRRPVPSRSSGERLAEFAADQPDPDQIAADREQQERVRSAVSELPQRLREIIVLRYSAGLRFEEIAGLLGIPLGTALSRGHAALERLKKRLERRDVSSTCLELLDTASGPAP